MTTKKKLNLMKRIERRNAQREQMHRKARESDGEPEMYRYYTTQRPPMPGAIPSGAFGIMSYDRRAFVPSIGREAWGYAEYKTPLTPEQITDYELTPEKGNHNG